MATKLKHNESWTCFLCFTKVVGPVERAKHLKERHPELKPGWVNAGNKGNTSNMRFRKFPIILREED